MCSRGWRASRPESSRASTRVRTPGGVRHVGREATRRGVVRERHTHRLRVRDLELPRRRTQTEAVPSQCLFRRGARFPACECGHAVRETGRWASTLTPSRSGLLAIPPGFASLEACATWRAARGTGARQSLRTRRARRRAQPGWRSAEASSERRTGCPQRTSGAGAWAAPDDARRGSNRRRLKRRRRPASHRAR